MSNALAIATVTAVLRRTLLEAVQADIPAADVTMVRPAAPTTGGMPSVGVNIFLYEVAPNPAWRNADLPTRTSGGNLVRRPQTALDLHYVFSFFGDDGDLEPQRLLGIVARTLHARPLITQAMIDATIADATLPFLAASDLADQLELVRLCPLGLSLEDISKLWSMFFQTPYALSIAYRAGAVLIETDDDTRDALPVRDYVVRAVTIRRPTIVRVVSRDGIDRPIVAGGAVAILGDLLRTDDITQTTVELGGQAAVIQQPGQHRIEALLPAGLGAGLQPARVHHTVLLGQPAVPHRGFSSNLGAFVLQPRFATTTTGAFDITVSNVQGSGSAPRSADVAVRVVPLVGEGQQVLLEMLTTPAGVTRHTFPAPARNAATDLITFAISGVTAGNYLVRVRIDGADSPLEVDASGQPTAPLVTIP
jgi:hypothetical protein